eukprot:TRINITY_DN10378_c0_g1_i1.p1 TRINITY_DN10378_c0_g1~~TRINITY_DN10378_c0_g1_i1.p1  ORF type:complete len:1148 (-),score=238.63 TRINITY_DN10378_c0_g1_i1:15-3041(-)
MIGLTPGSFSEEERITGKEEMVKKRLNQIISTRLLTEYIPKQFTDIRVSEGKLVCTVENEFTVSLSLLEGFTLKSAWNVIDLDIHIQPDGINNYIGKYNSGLDGFVQDQLRKTKEPFQELYDVIHTFCNNIQLDVLNSQSNRLRERRKGVIKISKILFSLDTESLIVYYWKQKKPTDIFLQQDESIESTYVKVYVNSLQQITIEHFPPLIEPETKEAILLKMASNKLNMESLLIKAATEHIHYLLHNMYNLLKQSGKNLKCRILRAEYNQFLEVPLFASVSVAIFINIRNGKYYLKPTGGLEEVDIKNAETKLNENPGAIVEIITVLHQKSVLITFKDMANYFGVSHELEFNKEVGQLLKDDLKSPHHDKLFFTFSSLKTHQRSNVFVIVIAVDGSGTPNFSLLSLKETRIPQKAEIRTVYPIDITIANGTIHVKFKKEKNIENPEQEENLEPEKKKRRIESPISIWSTDVISDGWSFRSCFGQILHKIREKVNLLCILDKVSDKGISLKSIPSPDFEFREKYAFEYPCVPLLVNEIYICIGKSNWKVEMTELRPLPVFPYGNDKNENRSITYSPATSTWTFSYPKILVHSFTQFLEKDLTGLINIATLAKQFLEWKNNPRIDEKLRKIFELVEFTAVKFTLKYSNMDIQKKISVIWSNELLNVKIGEQMSPIYGEHLNSELTTRKDVTFLLNTLIHTYPAIHTIEMFLKEYDQSIWSFVPRFAYRSRLIFRNTYGLDIRFLGGNLLWIQDAKTDFPLTDKTTKSTLIEIPNFSDYLSTLNRAIQIPFVSQNGLFVPENPQKFRSLLEYFYKYFNINYIFSRLSQEKDNELCSFKFSMNFSQIHNPVLVMDEIYSPSGNDVTIIIKSLKKNIQLDNLESIQSFLKIFKMPRQAFQEIWVYLTTRYNTLNIVPSLELVRCHPNQPPLEWNPETNQVSFRVSFIDKQTNAKVFNIGLKYSLATYELELWEPTSKDTVELFKSVLQSSQEKTRLYTLIKRIQDKLCNEKQL